MPFSLDDFPGQYKRLWKRATVFFYLYDSQYKGYLWLSKFLELTNILIQENEEDNLIFLI